MTINASHWLLVAGLSVSLAACAAAERSDAQKTQPLAGWYMQNGATQTFQPCGGSVPLPITEGADLRAKAGDFGLQDDNPIYVRLLTTGSSGQKTIKVARVLQFGSPTPVRDCAMNGVVKQDATPGQG